MITKISILSKFQNKTIRVISSLFIALGMVFSSMPFVDFTVKSEGDIYKEFGGGCINWKISNTRWQTVNTGAGFKAIYVRGSDSSVYLVIFSNAGDTIITGDNTTGSGCPAFGSGNTVISTNYGNYTISVSKNASYISSSGFELNSHISDNNETFTVVSGNFNSTYTGAVNDAIYYVFGDGNSNSQINYGNIKDLAYSTKISGGSVDQNHDCIYWYPYWDTNNNVAVNWNMEIRVVPGTYTSDTQNGLFALDPKNFVTNLGASVYVYQGAYSKGSIEVSWLKIKELLTPLQFATSGLFSFFDGEYWTKKGWMYQARYIDPENAYTSEWQNIYTVTSSSGKGVEDVIDPSTETNLPDFYQNVNDSYNQIFNTTSTVNNNYNQVYYVNSAPYFVNPSEEPEEPDSETDRILEEILRVTIQIRQLIQQDQNDGDEKDPEDTGLNDKDKELHDKEKELIDDMDDKLNDIDTDVELIDNNGFLAAANWVRLQYDHLTLNTPFELVIVFALVLGIGLIFIGKVR